MDYKICSKCGDSKLLSAFQRRRQAYKKDKNKEFFYYAVCKECNKDKKSDWDKQYRITHKLEKSVKDKKYREANKRILADKKKDYYLANKAQFIERNLRNEKKRRLIDPAFRLRKCVSASIRKCINKKNFSFTKFVPYTIQELKEHLEKQFEPWMTWDNHGNYNPATWADNDFSTWTWQLDHIVPQSDLLYTSMQDVNFKKCWNLNNLRPLSAKINNLDGTSRKRHAR